MPEKWTGDIVGKMHVYEITQRELADELSLSNSYVCLILHSVRHLKDGERQMREALNRIIERRYGHEESDESGRDQGSCKYCCVHRPDVCGHQSSDRCVHVKEGFNCGKSPVDGRTENPESV